jgi:hypothetical protein
MYLLSEIWRTGHQASERSSLKNLAHPGVRRAESNLGEPAVDRAGLDRQHNNFYADEIK